MKCVLILVALIGFCAAEFCREDQVDQDCIETSCSTDTKKECHNGVCTCEQAHAHHCTSDAECTVGGSSTCSFSFGSLSRNGHWRCSRTRNTCYCSWRR